MRSMTMSLRVTVLAVVMTVATAGLDAGVAYANPTPDPSAQPHCNYSLTLPSVVNVSGTDMVTATLSHESCVGEIQPNSMTVCVEMVGGGSPACKFSPLFDPVQTFYMPYRSGATYKSTGRGCGNVFPSGDQSCASVGPYSATL